MRTVEEVLAELRTLAEKRHAGQDVRHREAIVNRELAMLAGPHMSGNPEGGIVHVPSHQQRAPQFGGYATDPHEAMRHSRQGSRFIGPGGTDEAAAHLAAGGSFAPGGYAMAPGQTYDQRSALPAGWHVAEPPSYQQRGMGGGRTSLASFLSDTKALAESTPAAGGVLVPADLAQEIVTLVRHRVSVLALNPTIVPVAKELDIPSVSTGTAASYVQENQRIPVTEMTFAETPLLIPKDLGTLVPVSNKLLQDARVNPTLEDVVRSDLADSVGWRQDLSHLQGLGGTEPMGIRNHPGKTPAPDLGVNGRTPTLADFRGMVQRLRAANAPFRRPGWIFSGRTLATLENMVDADGRPLLDGDALYINPSGGGGRFLGYPFVTTGTLPENIVRGTSNDTTYAIFSSDWQECFIGIGGMGEFDLVIEVSREAPYSVDGVTWNSLFQQRQTGFLCWASHDLGLRKPQYFTVMEGIRP